MSGESMSDFVSTLTGTNGLTAGTIWGSMTDLVPLIVLGVTVGLGIYLFRKVAKGLSKGKFRI